MQFGSFQQLQNLRRNLITSMVILMTTALVALLVNGWRWWGSTATVPWNLYDELLQRCLDVEPLWIFFKYQIPNISGVDDRVYHINYHGYGGVQILGLSATTWFLWSYRMVVCAQHRSEVCPQQVGSVKYPDQGRDFSKWNWPTNKQLNQQPNQQLVFLASCCGNLSTNVIHKNTVPQFFSWLDWVEREGKSQISSMIWGFPEMVVPRKIQRTMIINVRSILISRRPLLVCTKPLSCVATGQVTIYNQKWVVVHIPMMTNLIIYRVWAARVEGTHSHGAMVNFYSQSVYGMVSQLLQRSLRRCEAIPIVAGCQHSFEHGEWPKYLETIVGLSARWAKPFRIWVERR